MSSSSDDYSALGALQDLVDSIEEDHPFDEIEEILFDDDEDEDYDEEMSDESGETTSTTWCRFFADFIFFRKRTKPFFSF